MLRPIAVVLFFVVLNAIGFVAYRAHHSSDANAATISRGTAASQPKLDVSPKVPVAAPPTPILVEDSPVLEHTKSIEVDALDSAPPGPAPTVRRPPARPIVRKRVEHPVARPEAPAAKPTETPTERGPDRAPEKTAEKATDKLLEMEANPYKRGE